MPRFKYVAMDAKGKETEGVVEAETQSQAIAAIRGRGLFPTRVADATGGSSPRAARAKARTQTPKQDFKLFHLFKGRVRPKDLMVLTRQLATLVEAGLPLLRGLRILLKQERNAGLREALSGLGETVESGGTFSEALAQYPRIFDKLFVNMVKAGEAGGVLEVVLARLAEFMEKAERVKNKVKSAMIYPIVVLMAAVGILIFLLIKVIPQFQAIFADLLVDKGMPAITQFVIDVSEGVKNNGFLVLLGIVAIVVLMKLWKRTETGALAIDRFKLRTPMFGSLFTKTAVARFSRTLGTLMSSGVPVLQALNIVRDTAGNEVIARAIQKVHDAVKEGDSMAMPLESSGVFPGMVVSMVDVGEETGALPEMLIRIADNYDDEVDTAVEGLTSVIEPIMIVVLAFIIGTIVIAMFVPLISIIGEMSA